MSVRINPCFGCPLSKDCEQKADFKKRVSGLGLRSATFRCEKLTGALAVGTRIEIAAPIRDYTERGARSYGDYGFEFEIIRVAVPATIVASKDHEFACIVDREPLLAAMQNHGDIETNVDKVRFRKYMRHARIIRFLDEPKVKMCAFGNPILPNGRHDVREGECECGQMLGLERELLEVAQ